PEESEEIVPAVIVVIADADAGLPAAAANAGFFGDIGEGAVAIIFVEMRGGRFAGGPLFADERAVGEIDVEPTVVVVLEEADAGTVGFHDVRLIVGIAPVGGRGATG